MKKYQLWLQRKTYSQHLNNLMRIKLESSDRKLSAKMRSSNRSSAKQPEASITKDTSSLFLSPRDLSYIITARQLQKHKMRLVRSNEIVRENQQLVKRLNKIKPFVANTRPLDTTSYKLKRTMQRANEQQNSRLKQQNYQQFQENYQQNAKIGHKYQLTLTLHQLDQRIPSHPTTQLSLEVIANKTTAKSEFLAPQALQGHTFQFSFAAALPETVTIRVHQLKNLQHSMLSEFKVAVPAEGESELRDWSSGCKMATMRTSLTYKRLKPKFWSIKLFRV